MSLDSFVGQGHSVNMRAKTFEIFSQIFVSVFSSVINTGSQKWNVLVNQAI